MLQDNYEGQQMYILIIHGVLIFSTVPTLLAGTSESAPDFWFLLHTLTSSATASKATSNSPICTSDLTAGFGVNAQIQI